MALAINGRLTPSSEANDTLYNIFQTPTCAPNGGGGILNNGRLSCEVQFDLFNRGLLNNCTDFNVNGNGVTKWVNVSKAPVATNFTVAAAVCSTRGIVSANTSTPGRYGITATCLSAMTTHGATSLLMRRATHLFLPHG
jgi:hypothetical protein